MKDIATILGEHQTGGLPVGEALILNDRGEPCVTAYFVDAELDVFQVRFSPDPADAFEISHGKMTHIATGAWQLFEIIAVKERADELWLDLGEYYNDEAGNWEGWEHLSRGDYWEANAGAKTTEDAGG